jgi:hypothetical protein
MELIEGLLARIKGKTAQKEPLVESPLRRRGSEEILPDNRDILLKEKINNMKRDRNWYSAERSRNGIRDLIGTENADQIEEILLKGGTVIELGGGKLVSARMLANKYPNGNIIVIEPHIPEGEVPSNLRVVQKKAEDIAFEDGLYDKADAIYSVWSLDYVADKLGFLQAAYQMLKPGAKAHIHMLTSATCPALVKDLQTWESMKGIYEYDGRQLVHLTKDPQKDFDLGEYTFTTWSFGVQDPMLRTEYEFERK